MPLLPPLHRLAPALRPPQKLGGKAGGTMSNRKSYVSEEDDSGFGYHIGKNRDEYDNSGACTCT